MTKPEQEDQDHQADEKKKKTMKEDDNGNDKSTSSPPSPTRTASGDDDDDDDDENENGAENDHENDSDENLPPLSPPVSKDDRLLLYRHIEQSVDRRIGVIVDLPDTRKKGFFASSGWTKMTGTTSAATDDNDDGQNDGNNKYNNNQNNDDDLWGEKQSWVSKCGCRGRQMYYYRKVLLPTVASCLLLGLDDLSGNEADTDGVGNDEDDGANENPTDEPQSEEPTIDRLLGCVSLLLANIVMLSKGTYDARLRSIVKEVCVGLLMEKNQSEGVKPTEPDSSRSIYLLEKASVPKGNLENNIEAIMEEEEADYGRKLVIPTVSGREHATKMFEQIEKCITTGILQAMLAESQQSKGHQIQGKGRRTKTRQILVRTLQIGSVGLVVGGIFAVTGGLAAPGLVAAISALGIGTSSAAFATLTGLHAMMTLFGVTGGGMAAYKMKKRTATVTEWRIRKEPEGKQDSVIVRGLHATVCVSGWLVDRCDFQRPWGIMATDPPMKTKSEVLQRYFAVYGPDKIKFVKALLQGNRKEEDELWKALDDRYGRDPDHLLPFDRSDKSLPLNESQQISIMDVLATQVLPKESAQKLESIYSGNTLLIEMEEMNAAILKKEALANGTASETATVTTAEKEEEEEQCEGEGDKETNTESDPQDELLAQMEAMNAEVNGALPRSFDSGVSSDDDDDDHNSNSNTDHASNNEKAPSTPKAKAETAMVDGPETAGNDSKTSSPTSSEKNSDPKGLKNTSMDGAESNASGGDNNNNDDDDSDKSTESGSKTRGGKTVPKKNEYDMIVWDWQASYGGDMYTLTWETELLFKLCKVVSLLSAEGESTLVLVLVLVLVLLLLLLLLQSRDDSLHGFACLSISLWIRVCLAGLSAHSADS